MNKELEIWQFVARKLNRTESVILLVVAESSGSSPGRQGFKMIVAEDDLQGSIGGGMMEVNLVDQARSLLKEEKPGFVKTQIHRKTSPNYSGMICSGEQSVIFFKLNAEHLKLIRKIPVYWKKHKGRYLRITQNELLLPRRFKDHFAFKFDCESENDFIYEEMIGCKNKLFIVGGGHCALALSEFASKMDFHIALYDDRADLNTLAKNEYVHEKHIIESYENINDYIPSGANHFVVVMTLGYKTDKIVITKLLDKNFKYFGVLGSRAKMATLLKDLRKEGVPEEKLNQIYTPIGLPINSRTPEEIAISIAAEIIAVKNKIA